jgi:hypothetical protein
MGQSVKFSRYEQVNEAQKILELEVEEDLKRMTGQQQRQVKSTDMSLLILQQEEAFKLYYRLK